MNTETISVIAEAACGTVLIARSEQEQLNIKKAMIRVASNAIKEVEELDKQAIEFYQQRYLSSLEEGAEKQAVERAFEAVLADFIKDK
jgi:hypothetical protein